MVPQVNTSRDASLIDLIRVVILGNKTIELGYSTLRHVQGKKTLNDPLFLKKENQFLKDFIYNPGGVIGGEVIKQTWSTIKEAKAESKANGVPVSAEILESIRKYGVADNSLFNTSLKAVLNDSATEEQRICVDTDYRRLNHGMEPDKLRKTFYISFIVYFSRFTLSLLINIFTIATVAIPSLRIYIYISYLYICRCSVTGYA